jgi:hypothetical protein
MHPGKYRAHERRNLEKCALSSVPQDLKLYGLELGDEGSADGLHERLSDEDSVEGSAAEELVTACEELKALLM